MLNSKITGGKGVVVCASNLIFIRKIASQSSHFYVLMMSSKRRVQGRPVGHAFPCLPPLAPSDRTVPWSSCDSRHNTARYDSSTQHRALWKLGWPQIASRGLVALTTHPPSITSEPYNQSHAKNTSLTNSTVQYK